MVRGFGARLAHVASWACALIWLLASDRAQAQVYVVVNVSSAYAIAATSMQVEYWNGTSWVGYGSNVRSSNGALTINIAANYTGPWRLRAISGGVDVDMETFGSRITSGVTIEIYGNLVFSSGSAASLNITSTVNLGAAGPSTGWKMRYCFSNVGTVPQDYTLGEWNAGTGKFDLSPDGFVTVAPGEQFCAEAETGTTEKGKLGWLRRGADGVFTVIKTWDETFTGWEQTTGTPSITSSFFDSGQQATTTGNTGGGTFTQGTVVQDTSSKDSPSISFGTATGSASESSVKTGFSSVRSAIGEGNASNAKELQALGGKLDVANSELQRIGDALTTDPPEVDATGSGTTASAAVRGEFSDLAAEFAGLGGSYTPPAAATVWPFTVGPATVDLYPLGSSGTVSVVNFAKYLFAWGMAVTLVWWAWRETYNSWIFTTVVPQATAASNTPFLSSGSAGLMAGIISTSMLAIPMVFVTWLGVGAYPDLLASSPFDGLEGGGSDAETWLNRFLWLADYIVPWATVVAQIGLRFVYHFTLSGAYALSSTIIKFAVG